MEFASIHLIVYQIRSGSIPIALITEAIHSKSIQKKQFCIQPLPSKLRKCVWVNSHNRITISQTESM